MNLHELESRLRALVETHLVSAWPGQKPEDMLVARLLAAMHASIRTDSTGARIAPNVYTLLVHPSSLGLWKERGLLETLLDIIKTAAADSGLRLDTPPRLTFAEDPRTTPGDFRIVASHSTEPMQTTQDMVADSGAILKKQDAPNVPENAFLIVEGVKEFPLRDPVVNIGRRLDNSLVVDDPRVSRHHAQLRAIKGRYVLFDLNSSGGTFINGQRASQSILYPGDVISLAGVSLIFGQDNPLPQRDLSKTAPRSQVGAERRTAIIRSTPPILKKRP